MLSRLLAPCDVVVWYGTSIDHFDCLWSSREKHVADLTAGIVWLGSILGLCRLESIPYDFEARLEALALDGNRVLAAAFKPLPREDPTAVSGT